MNVEGVVCVCSRGLMMSRTAESVDRNKENMAGLWVTEYTHDDPIPDAQNNVTDKALARNPQWIWYVEEDIVPPFKALNKMVKFSMNENIPVVSAWYGLDGGLHTYEKANDGTLLFSGLGCLLVNVDVFRQLEKPYFSTDTTWTADLHNAKLIRCHDRGLSINYGKQDIHFWGTLFEHGIKSALINIECMHLAVAKYGEPNNNNGVHTMRRKG